MKYSKAMHRNVIGDANQSYASMPTNLSTLIKNYIVDDKRKVSIKRYLNMIDYLDWSTPLSKHHELVMVKLGQ